MIFHPPLIWTTKLVCCSSYYFQGGFLFPSIICKINYWIRMNKTILVMSLSVIPRMMLMIMKNCWLREYKWKKFWWWLLLWVFGFTLCTGICIGLHSSFDFILIFKIFQDLARHSQLFCWEFAEKSGKCKWVCRYNIHKNGMEKKR